MKIVYTTNQKKSKDIDIFINGIKSLGDYGHNITFFDPLRDNVQNIEKTIKNCDLFISEVTEPDTLSGFYIARALSENKVCIIFSHETTKQKSISTILKHKNLLSIQYSAKNFSTTIDNALSQAVKKMDSKFILIISQDIERYLNWCTKSKRMHKAQVVRNAIEGVMKKDEQFKKESKENN